MKKIKEEEGITLVALIITIVVLLILAVVSIGAVKDSGIIGHAENATIRYEEEKGIEENRLKGYELLIKNKIGEYEKNEWEIRGLTVAKTDVTYFGISNDEGHTAEVFLSKNGEIQLKLDGNQQPYTSNDTTVKDKDILTIPAEEIELKFIDNGNAAEIRMSGSLLGTLYINNKENMWTKRGLTAAKIDVTYLGTSNDGGHTAELFLDKYGGIQLKFDGNEQIFKDITVTSNTTLSISGGIIEFKFIDNGNAAELRENGTLLGILYVVDEPKILSDFTYSNGIITGLSAQGIQKVTSGQTEIVIPTEIDGQAITGIATRAFAAYEGDTIETFKERTGYNKITKITIPGTIQTIGEYAFAYNQSLKTLIYQEGVKTAGKYSFLTCNNLEYIELPSTIEYIVQENKDHGQGEGSGSKLVIKINKTSEDIITLSQTAVMPWSIATIKDKDGNVVTKPTT